MRAEVTPFVLLHESQYIELNGVGVRELLMVASMDTTSYLVADTLYRQNQANPEVFMVTRKQVDYGWVIEWLFLEDSTIVKDRSVDMVRAHVYSTTTYVEALAQELFSKGA